MTGTQEEAYYTDESSVSLKSTPDMKQQLTKQLAVRLMAEEIEEKSFHDNLTEC